MTSRVINFVNREEELTLVTKLLDVISQNGDINYPYLEYIGIGGIGKTALLDIICAECLNRSIPFFSIDINSISAQGKDVNNWSLIETIINDLMNSCQSDEVVQLQTSFIQSLSCGNNYPDPLTNPSHHLVHKLCAVLESNYRVFLFDSLDRINQGTIEYFGQEIVLALSKSSKSLIIFGSRIEIDWGTAKYKIRRRSRTRHLAELNRLDTKKQLAGSSHECLSEEIYTITNGHPRSNNIVSDILSYLEIEKNEKFTCEHFGDYEKRLIEAVVDNALKDVVVPSKLLKAFCVLSILRTVDLDIPIEFQVVIDQDVPKDGRINIFDIIRETNSQVDGIFTYSEVRKCYIMNDFVRKTLSLYMRLFYEKEYRILSEKAIEYYERKLSSAPINIFFIVEKLYHHADILRMSEPKKYDIEIAKHLKDSLKQELKKSMASVIYRETQQNDSEQANMIFSDPGERRRSLDRLRAALVNDQELQERLGDRENPNFLVQVVDEYNKESLATGKAILDILKYQSQDLTSEDSEIYAVAFVISDRNIDVTQNIKIPTKWKEKLIKDTRQLSTIDELIDLGKMIKNQLIPSKIQEMLNDHEGPLVIRVNDTTIPWELIHDGRDFTVLRLPSGKRLRTAEEPKTRGYHNYQNNRVLLIGVSETSVEGYSNLSYVEDEITKLSELLVTFDSITFNPAEDALIGGDADSYEVTKRLSSGKYKIVHFAGHALYDELTKEGGLVLNDRIININEIKRSVEGTPFIFLNACQSAVDKVVDLNIGYVGSYTLGIASSFMLSGAIACVGTILRVADKDCVSFALKFYRELFSGSPLGEALLRSKIEQRIESYENRTWAAYVLYGDPTIKVIV